MRELSIKIKIADREYPMKVDADNEEKLRLAGKLINEKLKNFRDTFGIDDKQDLLAMVAFGAFVDKIELEETNSDLNTKAVEELNQLSDFIQESLKE